MHLQSDAQQVYCEDSGVAPCTCRMQLALPATGSCGKLPANKNGVQRDSCRSCMNLQPHAHTRVYAEDPKQCPQ